ncbi:unnamed protein product, partial [marine sediment metagenome]
QGTVVNAQEEDDGVFTTSQNINKMRKTRMGDENVKETKNTL